MTNGEKISRKDKMTIIISILALTVSFTSLYVNYFYESYDVEAIVVESDPLGGELDYQIALFNKGNRKILLTEAMILRTRSKNDNALYADNPLKSIHLETKLPAILEPKDVLLLRFKGPLILEQLFNLGEAPDPGEYEELEGKPTRKLTLEANIKGLDFSGNQISANIGAGSLHFTTTSVATAAWPHKSSTHLLHK